MKLLRFIFKQYDIGNWWGAAKTTVSNATVYLSLFNTAMIVPMAYVTWISPWFQSQGGMIPFWLFGCIVLVGAIVVLLLQYKLSTPSEFSFFSDQIWQHNNPMRTKLEEHDKKLAHIEEMLEKLSGN